MNVLVLFVILGLIAVFVLVFFLVKKVKKMSNVDSNDNVVWVRCGIYSVRIEFNTACGMWGTPFFDKGERVWIKAPPDSDTSFSALVIAKCLYKLEIDQLLDLLNRREVKELD
ncbi:hypothetical protein KKF17_00110 [Patescibacteria group bacterium]|nr:hypothetical protein [Patescibacteria group bacterium]